MIKKIQEIYLKFNNRYNIDRYIPIILYLFFGGLTTVINIVCYEVFTKIFFINYMLSNIIAWIITVIVAYLTNRENVFKSSANSPKEILMEILKFFGVRIATLGLDVVVMFVGVTILSFNDTIIKILSNVAVIVTNYFMSKYIVFKNNKKG